MRRGLWAMAIAAFVLGVAPAGAHGLACGADVLTDTTLTEDVTCPNAGFNVHGGVTFDLGGHTITGSGSGTAIQTEPGASDITIRNGTVTGFINGVYLRQGSSLTVENIVTTGNSGWGLAGLNTNGFLIDRVTATRNGGLPLSMFNPRNGAITRSTAADGRPGGNWNGLQVVGGTNVAVTDNTVTDNVVGVSVSGTDLRVQRNAVSANRLGIEGDGTNILIEGNTADRNTPFGGIEVDDADVTIKDNVARNNEGWGIRAPGSSAEDSGNRAGGNGRLAQCDGIACTILDPQPSWTGNAFGTVDVGQSAVQTLTVANRGPIDLVLGAGAPVIGGTDAADFSLTSEQCSGHRLGDDESCTAGVRFTPRGTGVRSAYLEWPGGTSTGKLRIPLSGRGQQCSLVRLNLSLLGIAVRVCI